MPNCETCPDGYATFPQMPAMPPLLPGDYEGSPCRQEMAGRMASLFGRTNNKLGDVKPHGDCDNCYPIDEVNDILGEMWLEYYEICAAYAACVNQQMRKSKRG